MQKIEDPPSPRGCGTAGLGSYKHSTPNVERKTEVRASLPRLLQGRNHF